MKIHRALLRLVFCLVASAPAAKAQFPADCWTITKYPSGFSVWDIAPGSVQWAGAYFGSGRLMYIHTDDGKRWTDSDGSLARLDVDTSGSTVETYRVYGYSAGVGHVACDTIWFLVSFR